MSAAPTSAGPRAHVVPTLRHERRLLRAGYRFVAGMDEVGRGALAGPVSVGVVVVDAGVRTAPSGVRDSKLLTPAARQALVPRLRRWAPSYAVGHAEPEEIDRYGIIAALRLAGRRALAALPAVPDCVLLDGSHDWLSPPRPRGAATRPIDPVDAGTDPLFDLPADAFVLLPPEPFAAPGREVPPTVPLAAEPQVQTMIKADLRCAAVAAASVLAKVERDAIMVERSSAAPQYRWHENKGYSAPDHLAALAADGPCAQHRRSWSLPGVDGGPALIDLADLVDLAEAVDDVELTDAELEDAQVEDAQVEDARLGDDDDGGGARQIRRFAALGHDERR